MLDQHLVFVDLETTGTNPVWDRIIEIGLCEVRQGRLVDTWSSLVNPGVRISPFIQNYTGITDAMVEQAPSFAELAEELHARLHGRLLVAHNARFDYGFLKNAFRNHRIGFQERVLCTVKLSRRLYPQHRRHGLDALIERHGLRCAERHRALGDALALWDFVQKIHQELPAEAIDAALRAQLKQPSLPLNLPAAQLENLPEAPGVYRFFGSGNSLLYVGKSVNLRTRVLSHFSGDHRSHKGMRLAQQVERIEWTETAGELGALLLEARQIRELLPILNRRQRRSRSLCSLRLEPAAEDFARPRTTLLKGFEAARLDDLYGLFRTPKEAEKLLRSLVDEQGLCARVLGLEKGTGACFSHQLKKCRGACVGREPAALHNARLFQALAALRVRSWPFRGRVGLRESNPDRQRTEIHLLDNWCHLGTAGSEAELAELLERPAAIDFDLESYKILSRFLAKPARLDMVPMPA